VFRRCTYSVPLKVLSAAPAALPNSGRIGRVCAIASHIGTRLGGGMRASVVPVPSTGQLDVSLGGLVEVGCGAPAGEGERSRQRLALLLVSVLEQLVEVGAAFPEALSLLRWYST
jgi:hypothetical protein